MKIRQILQSKPINTLYAVTSTDSVLDALRMMADKNIGAVLVIDKEELSGIFSERDYARKIILQNRHSDETLVRDVMTPNVITIDCDQRLDEAMKIMSDKHIRHLPVMEGPKLVGIISINDVVTSIIRDQKNRINSLESYISGSPY